jgi:hypothetical protein
MATTLRAERWTTVRGVVLKVTPLAAKFEADSDEFFGEPTWIPRSMIEDGGEVDVGDTSLRVKHWWLERRRA